MGILSMLGLMRVEDHKRIVAKQDALIDRAAEHMKGEDFDRGTNHADRVGLIMARLRAARTRFEKAVKDLEAQAVELDSFRAKRDRDNAGRRERRARNATGAQKSGPPRTKKGAA